MKRKHLKIAIIVLVVLFIALVGWRIWPRSLSDVISVDKTSIISVSASARIGGIKDGEPYFDIYNMRDHQADGEVLKGILKILDSTAYQADFRNLLPWHIDSVKADRNYDDRSVLIVLGWGNNKEDYVEIQFLSSSIIAVRHESDSEFMIYCPTDRNIIDSLIEYIRENGNET